MSRYDRDYYTAREEAEWFALRVKFYTFVVVGGALTLITLITVILLGIFVHPGALGALFGVVLLALSPFIGYAEYGEKFHTETIVRRREREAEVEAKRKEDKMSLAEAERIVAAFGKGK